MTKLCRSTTWGKWETTKEADRLKGSVIGNQRSAFGLFAPLAENSGSGVKPQ
jgi:hypothetical protein